MIIPAFSMCTINKNSFFKEAVTNPLLLLNSSFKFLVDIVFNDEKVFH